MPPLKVYWYEGLNKSGDESSVTGNLRAARGDARNLPPLLLELRKQYPDDELDRTDSGTLYVGEKGVLYTATYGNKMHLVPMEKMQELKQPPRTMPRPKNVFADFLDACRAGKKETAAGFDYGAQLTEFTLLGNLAQKSGVGRKLEWDGPNMKVKHAPELSEWLKRPVRQGWSA